VTDRPYVVIQHDGTELEFPTPVAFLMWFGDTVDEAPNTGTISAIIAPSAFEDIDDPPCMDQEWIRNAPILEGAP
jgi:hypothetical protein